MTTGRRQQELNLLDGVAYDLHRFLTERNIRVLDLEESGVPALGKRIKEEAPHLYRELASIGRESPTDSEYVWRSAIALPLEDVILGDCHGDPNEWL